MIKNTGVFNISVLDESADFELFKHFGFQSGFDTDKFSDFQTMRELKTVLFTSPEALTLSLRQGLKTR